MTYKMQSIVMEGYLKMELWNHNHNIEHQCSVISITTIIITLSDCAQSNLTSVPANRLLTLTYMFTGYYTYTGL